VLHKLKLQHLDEIDAMTRSDWMHIGDHKNGCVGGWRIELCDQFVLIDGS
jgi:hypothetical protein